MKSIVNTLINITNKQDIQELVLFPLLRSDLQKRVFLYKNIYYLMMPNYGAELFVEEYESKS